MSCTNLPCSALIYHRLSCLDLSWRVLVVLVLVSSNVIVQRLQRVCGYTCRCPMFERVCAPASPPFLPLWLNVFLYISSTSYFRYIPAAAAFGGMCIGLLTVLADFLGTYAPAFDERMWRHHNRSHFFTLFSPSPLLTPHSFRDNPLLTPFFIFYSLFPYRLITLSLCRRHRVRHGHSPRSNYYLSILWNVREDQRWPQRLRRISSHTYVRTYAPRPLLTQITEVMLLPQNEQRKEGRKEGLGG